MNIYVRNMKNAVLVWMLLPVVRAQDELYQSAVTEDYCMSEPFQPRCLRNEVLLIKSATYGRMRIGRCITAEEVEAHRSVVGEDLRYLGCSSDVLHLLHRKCSGLSECDVRLSEISANNIKPCFPGLTAYLQVTYQCVNVADEDRSCALFASTSKKLTCGTKSQPWIVEAPAGQRIRLSLLDFAASTEDGGRAQRKQPCSNYGVIVDKTGKRNVSICGGGEKGGKELCVSRGNEVDIIFNDVVEDENTGDGKRFMLIIESIGCSDLIPPEDAWLKRNEDTIVIGCYVSRKTWHLNCQEGNWIGVFGNCSQGLSAHDPTAESESIKTESWSDGQVLAIVSIGGLTLAVSLAILCAGIICLRRFSVLKQKSQNYKTINHAMNSTRRQQANEMNSQNTATVPERNGLPDFGTQQMPTYSVFLGDTGFSNIT